MTVHLHTLGCKLNYTETMTFLRQFARHGVRPVSQPEEAAILVVNSCAVTEQAERKCRQYIRRARRLKPDLLIVLVGCYASLSPEELRAEGVDLVVSGAQKGQLAELALGRLRGEDGGDLPVDGTMGGCEQDFFNAYAVGGRTRAFLKVQDGCDYRCSYCTIPLARGASRSPSIETLVREAELIAQNGVREIVLSGVNTGDFGRARGENLLQLLVALDGVEGIARYRVSSIEPNLLSDDLLAFIGHSPRFLPHLHIPLQSGDDETLRRMGRRYNTRTFHERIAAARRLMGDPFIGVDVIVGFPGEDEAAFRRTYRFLEGIGPAFLHVFPYSPRPGTPAAAMPDQVPPGVQHARVVELMALSDRLHEAYCTRYEGEVRSVLVEGTRRGGAAFGFTDNYIKLAFRGEGLPKGGIVPVKVRGPFANGAMRGEVLYEKKLA